MYIVKKNVYRLYTLKKKCSIIYIIIYSLIIFIIYKFYTIFKAVFSLDFIVY